MDETPNSFDTAVECADQPDARTVPTNPADETQLPERLTRFLEMLDAEVMGPGRAGGEAG